MTNAIRFYKWGCFVGRVSAIALLALIVSAVVCYLDLHRAEPMNYASAIVTVRDYAPIRSIKIRLDAASANRLATYFPQLGRGQTSGIAGAWMSSVEVDFKAADGAITNVASNFEVWSEGSGDWATQPGLEAYIFSIRLDAERKSRRDASNPRN
jgi:hypothetical protein